MTDKEEIDQIKAFFDARGGADEICSEDVHVYFGEFGYLDCFDIAEQGNKIFGYFIDEVIEEESMVDMVVSGVAAHTSNAVFRMLSNITGLDQTALACAVEGFDADENHEYKPSIGLFLQRYSKAKEFIDSIDKEFKQ